MYIQYMHTSWTVRHLYHANTYSTDTITGINTAKVGTNLTGGNWSSVLSAIYWKYIEILLWPIHHWIKTKASLVQYNILSSSKKDSPTFQARIISIQWLYSGHWSLMYADAPAWTPLIIGKRNTPSPQNKKISLRNDA